MPSMTRFVMLDVYVSVRRVTANKIEAQTMPAITSIQLLEAIYY